VVDGLEHARVSVVDPDPDVKLLVDVDDGGG